MQKARRNGELASAIAPYVTSQHIRPSDPRMIGFLQALSQASSS